MNDPDLEEAPERQVNEEPHFLADSEVAEAFDRILEEFSRESDRGAVLIAADIVSGHLERVITALAPETLRKKRLKDLLNYPGPLASFAARADMAFMAGFIGETAHRSVDVLRRLRNKAAHSQGTFGLANHRDMLRAICDLGPGTVVGVNRFALDLIFRAVVKSLLERGVELEAEIGSNPFTSPSEIIEYISEQPEAMKALEGRLPRMELAFGVWLLLGLISHQRKKLIRERCTRSATGESE